MKRRIFLAAAAVALTMPALSLAGAGATIDFDKSNPIQAALNEGKTVFVDFAADWCSTCKVQERVIDGLRASNPDYDANIVFVRVDWDDFGKADVTKDLNIPRRSTLVVLQGDTELGRIVAGTSESDIKALMDTALTAATSA